MTSNHFLFVILYFLSNFFLFIAEASASTDQELKSKFFNDQCQTGCSPEFKACYQKLSENDRNAIMNDLIGRRVLQKVQTVEGSGFYNYGSETIPTATAKTEFNKAVGSKCQAIAVAAANAAQSQVAKSSESSPSGKSDSGGSSGDLLAAAKQMAPVVGAIPGVKAVVDKAKDKVKEVAKNVGDSITGKKSSSDSVAKNEDVSNSSVVPSSTSNTNYGSVNSAENVPSILKSNVPQSAAPSAANQNSAIVDSSGQQIAPNYQNVKSAPTPAESKNIANQSLAQTKPEVDRAPAGVKPKAEEVANPENLESKDATAATQTQNSDNEASQIGQKIKASVDKMANSGPFCSSEVKSLSEVANKYSGYKNDCNSNAISADNFCNTVRSPKALDVQKMISAGTAVLSKATAASESCGVMGNVSTIANGGMLAAQAICSGYKFRCDFSCADAKKNLTEINNASNYLELCLDHYNSQVEASNYPEIKQYVTAVQAERTNLASILQPEPEKIAVPVAQCEKNGADILTMGAQAAALLSAAMDSKKCEEQLSSGDGKGSGSGSIATTAQFCAQPGNSSSITCRCAADPNGAGCLGALGSGSDVSGFAGFQKGVGNVSGFSSTGAPKISDSDIQFGDIPSDVAAKTDNGLSPTSPFGAAAATGGGGGSGGGGVAGSSKPAGAAGEEEKSKFSMGFSSLAKGFGNLFGLKGNDKGGKSLSKEQKDVQLQAIKRKIASDQVRAEISTASGKSNFDKIKDRYAETRSSLISSP